MKILNRVTQNTNHRKIFALILISILMLNCKSENKKADNVFLEIYYLSPHAMYPFKVPCEVVESGPLSENSERDYLKVQDEIFIKKFSNLYSKLQDSDSLIDVDGRIQILAHFNNYTDTICMGTAHGIVVNGKLKNDLPVFSKLITDLVVENYSPRRIKN